ncbi:KTSC domain-containing protein [Solitalea sp. MAHUQ-68]|uniref:KTSC domain-containing protein n=1 Tax=Solitalea agri TaxID=2953739 RepID=A0A9X2JCS4_9SPHI|nr:KTSC domain-containing protein [Solitalea agri]MCO4293797.1 KTSC domain-containing protein [Solitalea agri]
MKSLLLTISLILSLGSTYSQNCHQLPKHYSSYEQAISLIKKSDFVVKEQVLTPESSFINNVGYYSCDGYLGFMIITMNGKSYLYANVPLSIWKGFKIAESKGKYYHAYINGRYKFSLTD